LVLVVLENLMLAKALDQTETTLYLAPLHLLRVVVVVIAT
jgi:hypothetical protein